MKILAINTAGPTIEVALCGGGYFRDTDNRNASALLMPAIDDLLIKSKLTVSDLNLIACVVGPGSFTGIRIGISSVRAMCYSCGAKAVPVNYLQMLAYNESADGAEKILCVTDGSNGTAYIAEYDGMRREISPVTCVLQKDALDKALNYAGAVCGDEKTSVLCSKILPPDTQCRALIKAAAALSNNAVNWENLLPLYVRESQAEKDLKEREKNA